MWNRAAAREFETRMRVRVRSIDRARALGTERIEVPDACTLGELREALRPLVERDLRARVDSERASESDRIVDVDARNVRVSLNGSGDLGEGDPSRESASVRSLGVRDGDLVRFGVDDAGREGRAGGDRATTTTANAVTNRTVTTANSEADVTMSDGEGEVPRKMRAVMEEWRGPLEAEELAFLAAHALMLDMGAKTIGDVALRDGLARCGCYSARYGITGPNGMDTIACTVRAQPVDGQLSLFGALETNGGPGYATLIRAIDYVNGGNLTPESCRSLWQKVKEGMANKVFDDARAHFAGVLTPGTLMSLPKDVKRKIAEKMNAYSLAYSACTCRELREVCSDEELWTNLLQEDFGIDQMTDVQQGGITSRSLYNQHAIRRSAEREARLRMESFHPMPGRLPRHGLEPDPERDIYPGHLPGHVPGIIGGDYDMWPGGLNPNPTPRPIPGFGRGGLGGPGRPRGGWPGGGPPFPPQPGGLPYNPDPDADLRNPPGRGFPGPPNPGWDGRPRPPPDFF